MQGSKKSISASGSELTFYRRATHVPPTVIAESKPGFEAAGDPWTIQAS